MKPAKSSGSQPEVFELGSGPGGRTTSTAWTVAVTSPEAEKSIVAKSVPGT